MKARGKSEDQLINELTEMRRKVGELEATAAKLRETEKALRESEERFRLLYENAPLGYQSLDENGYFLEVNKAWLDTLGYSREEVVGKWFGDFLAPGYQDHFKTNFPRFKAAGEIHWVEFEMLRKDGTQISVAFDGQIGRDQQGRFKQTHCILHDISEIKRSQDALKDSEQRYRAVVDNVEVGISLLNTRMEIVEVNKAFKQYFPHVRPGCGQICYEQYNDPPRSEPCPYCPCVLTLQDGEVHEAITETPAGSEVRRYHLVSSPIKDSDGRVQYVIELTEDITERKQAEEAADRANKEWERTFKAISDGIMVLDSEHKILRANEAMANALGMTESELIGKSCFELVHGTEGPPAFCPHSQLLADGEEHHAEVLEPRLGATLDVRVSPIFDQKHKVIGSVDVIRDITERKRAEEALRESEEKYKTLFEESFDGLFITSPAGKILDMNKKGIGIFGYDTKEEMLSLDLERDVYAHPPDRRRILSMVNAEGSAEYEVLVKKKNGEEMVAHCSLVAVRDEQGVITAYRGIVRDITDRKKAAEALRKSEERYRLLVDMAPDAIVVSQDGRVIYVNRAAMQLLDATDPGQIVGTHPTEWVHPDDRALVTHRMQVLLASETLVPPAAWRLLRRDGTVRDVEAVSGSLRSGESMIIHAMLRDITDRKRTENIMRARLRLVEYATSHSLDELLQATLDEAEVLTDSLIGFYHFLEADQKTLWLQAWSTRTLREMCTAEGKGLHYDIDEAGVWVDCVRERRPVIHNDYSALPHRKGMPAGHANVIRELVVPVFRGDRLVAVLGVGNKPVDYAVSDIETVSLLADLAWDIAERKLAEEALRTAGLYNRSLIEASLDPLVTISTEGKITDVNRATEKVTGYLRNGLLPLVRKCITRHPEVNGEVAVR